MYDDEFDFIEELTFVEYLMNIKVLTMEGFQSKFFRYFMFENFYDGYKRYCKENNIAPETIYFEN